MSNFDNPENLKLLKNLFISDKTAEISENPGQSVDSSKLSDEQSSRTTYSGAYSKLLESTTSSHPLNLEEWEQSEQLDLTDTLADRKIPEYRISYKQSVSPEDIFLRMGNKTAATASCEEMWVEIDLPDEMTQIDQMHLDVGPLEIELRTAIYHLKLALVQRIDVDRSKASWITEQKVLRLMLRMKREYDFINF